MSSTATTTTATATTTLPRPPTLPATLTSPRASATTPAPTGAPVPAPAPAGGGGGGGPGGGGGGGPGGGAGPGGPGGPVAIPPVALPPRFALTPALHRTNFLNFDLRGDTSVYVSATKPLSEDIKYDCDAKTLRNLLKRLHDRAANNGWDVGILAIPEDPANPLGVTTDLLTNYGTITLEHLRLVVAAYDTTQSRAAQDNLMLYECLIASLSTEAIDKVTAWEPEYTSHGIKSGVLLLKVVIRESHIDTNATTTHIRLQLSSLDEYIGTVGNDIDKFNTYVKTLLEALSARGETTNDLLANLLKGYKAAKDQKFVEYVSKIEEKYEDGIPLDPDTLMQRALNRYNIRKLKGLWEAPSVEQEMIHVLETKVERLEKAQKKGGKPQPKNDKPKKQTSNTPKQSPKATGKKKKDDSWRFRDPPKAGKEKEPRNVEDKEWWWCPNHKAWCRHKPHECKGLGVGDPKGSKPKPKDGDKKKLRFAQAYEVAIKDSETDEED